MSGDNCYVPFRRDGKRIDLALNCKGRVRPVARRRFFRRNISFTARHCVLATMTSNIMSNVNDGPARKLCRIVHCNGCRIACTRLTGTLTPFNTQMGTNDIINVDKSLLRVRIGCSKRRVGPVRFLTVLCNGLLTVQRRKRPNVPRLRAVRVSVPAVCSSSQRRVRRLVLHFCPRCLLRINGNNCHIPRRARRSLHGVFSRSTIGGCFCRVVPSLTGPLKVKSHSVPVTTGIRGLLVDSFLGCLTLHRRVFLSALDRGSGGGQPAGP